MNIKDFVHVNTSYTRSINIERDSEESGAVSPYVITTRAKQTLERIASTFKADDAPRAWALIGPYGAGKSAFGLFLSRLLGNPATDGNKYASQVLKESDPELHGQYQRNKRGGRGFCSIALTGSPEPLAKRLLHAMLPAAEAFFRGRPGRTPKIVDELKVAIAQETHGVSEIIALIGGLQESVSRADGRGVLIVIDELGKFLEFEARHRGATDIFLLQALAEHSVRKGPAPLLLVVLLHQAIELYAQSLGAQLKNEWKKVQGRFETIPFLESTEQTLRVLKAAFSAELPKALRIVVKNESSEIADRLADLGALPAGLPVKEAQELFAACYPLHPLSLLILPTLCQRVAQNERTLFSYLGSHEPHGFSDSISRLKPIEKSDIDWIRPSEIYEYFILNQPGLMSDPSTHRRWAEVTTALERLGDAPKDEVELLKTIGLLNIIGAQGGLKASDDLLGLCFQGKSRKNAATKRYAQSLIERSIISYRRFNHEYRVWQGSDFDLEAALRDQRAQMGTINPADVLNEQMPLPAIVARRHAIETGTMRYFSPVFVNSTNANRIEKTEVPTIFICLAETPEDTEAFREHADHIGIWHSLAVICGSGATIKDAVGDVLALRRIQQQSGPLANDPVAQRELRDRLATATRTQRDLVSAVFEDPANCEWRIAGSQRPVCNKRELQIRLSALLDKVYASAPIIRNELINRDKPSSTANAGRKKLLLAMLEKPKADDLGIEKFPAEKAMYRAILRATGLHVRQGDQWQFQPPSTGQDDVGRLKPTWAAVMKLLDADGGAPVHLATIYKTLSQPPFGIKAGLLPILIIAMYQSMRQEVALSENGQFIPFLTTEGLEGLLKNPNAFALHHFNVRANRTELFESYAAAITGESPKEASLIAILQPLAKLMIGLPDYTKRTKRVSAQAMAMRDLFFAAKAPADLVFVEMPKALGFAFEQGTTNPETLQRFTVSLKSALAELRIAYHSLLGEVVDMLKLAFALEPKLNLEEVRNVLKGRCIGLETYTIDPQCSAFVGRLLDTYGDDTQWLVGLASFLVRKPPEKWVDDDINTAKLRLTELVSRVRDLWKLQLHYEGARAVKHGDLEASLIRIVSTRDGERQALVTLDDQSRATVFDRAASIADMLETLPNNELKLAALAQAIKEIISKDAGLPLDGEQAALDSEQKGAA